MSSPVSALPGAPRRCLAYSSLGHEIIAFGLAAPAKILTLPVSERWGNNQNHSREELKQYEGFSRPSFPLSPNSSFTMISVHSLFPSWALH
jgi:hypothetical protein